VPFLWRSIGKPNLDLQPLLQGRVELALFIVLKKAIYRQYMYSLEAKGSRLHRYIDMDNYNNYICTCIDNSIGLRWPDTIYLHEGQLF